MGAAHRGPRRRAVTDVDCASWKTDAQSRNPIRFAATPGFYGVQSKFRDTKQSVQGVDFHGAKNVLYKTQDKFYVLYKTYTVGNGPGSAGQAQLQLLLASSGQARRGIKTVLGHLGGDADINWRRRRPRSTTRFASRDFAEGAAAFLEEARAALRLGRACPPT